MGEVERAGGHEHRPTSTGCKATHCATHVQESTFQVMRISRHIFVSDQFLGGMRAIIYKNRKAYDFSYAALTLGMREDISQHKVVTINCSGYHAVALNRVFVNGSSVYAALEQSLSQITSIHHPIDTETAAHLLVRPAKKNRDQSAQRAKFDIVGLVPT